MLLPPHGSRSLMPPVNPWAGFTLIEMLITAFVLGIGLLGLSLLQVMALKATRGGRSSTTAILLAEQILDCVEAEGRLSWLYLADGDAVTPTAADLTGLRYVTLGSSASWEGRFTVKGSPAAPNPRDSPEGVPFYTATLQRVPMQADLPTGKLSEFTVVVAYLDDTDLSRTPTRRTVTLVRRVIHG